MQVIFLNFQKYYKKKNMVMVSTSFGLLIILKRILA